MPGAMIQRRAIRARTNRKSLDSITQDGLLDGKWGHYEWPSWVPADIVRQVESFWAEKYGRGPSAWKASADWYRAPLFADTATLRDFQGNWKTGRFVFCWNNIGRLVHDDGGISYVSFHPGQLEAARNA